MSKVRAVGIGWYARQDYERIRELVEDGHNLPRSYDQWLRSAETDEKQLAKSGKKVVRAHIRPDEFISWYSKLGLKANADARMRWGNEFAYRSIMGAREA